MEEALLADMRKTILKKVKVIECDYCGVKEGEHDGRLEGQGHAVVKKTSVWKKKYPKEVAEREKEYGKLNCNHDICWECWYYPGDLGHCPVCGVKPNKQGWRRNRCYGSAKKPDPHYWCYKHNHGKQVEGDHNEKSYCSSCENEDLKKFRKKHKIDVTNSSGPK